MFATAMLVFLAISQSAPAFASETCAADDASCGADKPPTQPDVDSFIQAGLAYTRKKAQDGLATPKTDSDLKDDEADEDDEDEAGEDEHIEDLSDKRALLAKRDAVSENPSVLQQAGCECGCKRRRSAGKCGARRRNKSKKCASCPTPSPPTSYDNCVECGVNLGCLQSVAELGCSSGASSNTYVQLAHSECNQCTDASCCSELAEDCSISTQAYAYGISQCKSANSNFGSLFNLLQQAANKSDDAEGLEAKRSASSSASLVSQDEALVRKSSDC